MREVKGLRGYGIKGLRKTILNAGFLIPDWGGDCSRKACEYFTHAKVAKVGKPRRGTRRMFGIMHNVEMLRLAS